MAYQLWKRGDRHLIVNETGQIELSLEDIKALAAEVPPLSRDERDAKLRQMWKDGASGPVICHAMGLTARQLSILRRKLGLPTRATKKVLAHMAKVQPLAVAAKRKLAAIA